MMEKIEELFEQYNQLQTQWEDVKKWVGKEPALQQNEGALETEVKGLQEKIPLANQSSLYWESFNRVSTESGVSLSRLEEGKGPAQGNKPYTVTLAVSGTEASVLQCIDQMQHMTYVTAVKNGTIDYEGTTVVATLQLILGSRKGP